MKYVGYRYYTTVGKKTRFPFGFGLSYTSFEYSCFSVNEDGVLFAITNTGNVKGTEVAQLYIGRKSDTVYRPVRELKGFKESLWSREKSNLSRYLLMISRLDFLTPEQIRGR